MFNGGTRLVAAVAALFVSSLPAAEEAPETKFKRVQQFGPSAISRSRGFIQQTAEVRRTEAANAFLQNLRSTFQLSADSTFLAEDTLEVGEHVCVRYKQALKSIPILGTVARVCFDSAGEEEERAAYICDGECLRSVSGHAMKPSQAEEYAEIELRKRAEPFFNIAGTRIGTTDVGVVVRQKADPMWAESRSEEPGLTGIYRVEVDGNSPHAKFVAYLDGTSGEMITYEHRIFSAVGRADVYKRDPVVTPVLVPNAELFDLLSLNSLTNAHFAVLNDDTSRQVSRSDGDYRFDPRESEFDEAQVYYGLQKALSKYIEWGYEPQASLPIHVHYGDAYNNAFYDGTQIALGDGDGKLLFDLAKDNTVVTHEYGHAVVDNLAHILMVPFFGDGGAIHEGYGDYFACAVYDMPSIGEGVMPDRKPMRRCDGKLPFTTRWNQDPHVGGGVLSGALWEVRGTLGSDVGDRLALGALQRIDSSGWFGTTRLIDVPKAVVAADKALYRGSHERTLKKIFENRGYKKRSWFPWPSS